MMATQADPLPREPPADNYNKFSTMLKRFLGRNHIPTTPISSAGESEPAASDTSSTGGILRRASRRVVPGLPRAKTFKRQQSELREKLEPTKPTPAERRAVSVDRRGHHPLRNVSSNRSQHLPRASAPEFLGDAFAAANDGAAASIPQSPLEEKKYLDVPAVNTVDVDQGPEVDEEEAAPSVLSKVPTREPSTADAQSTTTSTYDAQIHDELEHKWILNLSMHFRDKSKREKFFVTYREKEFLWRRVTISLDYRDAPPESLEGDLQDTKFQREKSAKIYEAIRESLRDIQFYETVTNLKLQTTDNRLHVHVVEDVNEIIHFPTVRMVQHLGCRRIQEKDIQFDSHMSGFVYKVRVDGRTLIKKEIPGPDTVDEFLYEVNALNSLVFSNNTISFYGVVVDDEDHNVKGLLIEYAEKGALIDIIYDAQEHGLDLPWTTREKWARQIVQGLSDIHEAGFVQGDFTLSNIVIDEDDNAKIIDINRRGCPVGWEPPEATPLVDSNQRISMYIGVKSDLYQLGMVLWALAMLEDEPEAHRRPLRLDPEIEMPRWYRRLVEICLNDNPRLRLQATSLLEMFPPLAYEDDYRQHEPLSISVDDGLSRQQYTVEGYEHSGRPVIRTVTPQDDTYFPSLGYGSRLTSPGLSEDAYYYPPRGRSPPSPLPSQHDGSDKKFTRATDWSQPHGASSVSDFGHDESQPETPRDMETPGVREITRQLEGTLKSIGSRSRPRNGDEHDSAYEDVQSIDLESDAELTNAPKVVIDELEEVSGQRITGEQSVKSNPTSYGNSPGPPSLKFEQGALSGTSNPGSHVNENSRSTHETRDLKEEPISSPKCSSPLLHQGHDQADDESIDLNYAHNAIPTTYLPASDESTLPVPQPNGAGMTLYNAATDLTGIGAGYGEEDDFKGTISDDDLGIIPSTAAADVASRA